MAIESRRGPGGLATTFAYMAVTASGSRRFGIRRARDRRDLAAHLRSRRLVPIRSWSLPSWVGGESDLSLKDQAEIHFQLAQLLSRGVPLVEALDVTASSVTAASRPRVERLRDLVSSGSSFSEACRNVGSFDEVTVAVYRAAERTGELAGAARQLATSARRQLAISGKAVTLLIYPAIVMTISLAVSVFMLMVIVPRIASSLASNNSQLPGVTVFLWKTGDLMRENMGLLAMGVLAAAALATACRRSIAAAALRLMRRLPMVKGVVLAQESTRFFTVMAAMSRSGVTLADSLGVAVGALGHPTLKGQITRLRSRLIEGGVLRNLIQDVDAFPVATRRLMIAAERSGDLQSAFDTLAQDMAEEVERRSTRLLAALDPILIVFMFLMIGSLLMSVMIPLMNMTASAVV